MTTMRKGNRSRAAPAGLTDVVPLREVPRQPTCCDRPMHKMQTQGVASGKLVTVWFCDGCGGQRRETAA
jgi:hypothetical protein